MEQTAVIEAVDLSVRRADRGVLDGLHLVLTPGERLVITGAVGTGKSTLLQSLAGLLPVAAGRIWLFGHDCRTQADYQPLRSRIGLLFQDPDDQLFCPTVIEDVAFGPINRGLAASAAMTAAAALLDRFGISGLADRPIHELSGGERRLVALAGVLAMQPGVLLLDEPTAALDPAASRRVLAILAGSGLPMIVATHDPDCASQLGTRQLQLKAGGLYPLVVSAGSVVGAGQANMDM